MRRPLQADTADQIDGIIVTLPNFGDERAIADTLRMADLDVPVLVQATPGYSRTMTIRDRRDSFCGKMSACNNLKQYGIPYSLTTLHTEAPDSDIFAKDLDWFAAVCRVVRGLRRSASAPSARAPPPSTPCATAKKSWKPTEFRSSPSIFPKSSAASTA